MEGKKRTKTLETGFCLDFFDKIIVFDERRIGKIPLRVNEKG